MRLLNMIKKWFINDDSTHKSFSLVEVIDLYKSRLNVLEQAMDEERQILNQHTQQMQRLEEEYRICKKHHEECEEARRQDNICFSDSINIINSRIYELEQYVRNSKN